MSRIGRSVVEFEVDGVRYRSEFRHQHCEDGNTKPRGVEERGWFHFPYTVPIIDPRWPTLKLRHITTCFLWRIEDSALLTVLGKGFARCSMKDDYNWKKGVKLALLDCLDQVQPELDAKAVGQFLHAFYEAMRTRT